jgi:hypothetical protein
LYHPRPNYYLFFDTGAAGGSRYFLVTVFPVDSRAGTHRGTFGIERLFLSFYAEFCIVEGLGIFMDKSSHSFYKAKWEAVFPREWR